MQHNGEWHRAQRQTVLAWTSLWVIANPIYTGRIAHKGRLYPGQHPALIDDETWTAVQDQLAAHARDHRRRAKAAEPSLLAVAFLSPELVEAILQGREPVTITAPRLPKPDPPLAWPSRHRGLAS